MKKFLVVLLALVAVGGAFAQTPALTFGMYGDITANPMAVVSPSSADESSANWYAAAGKDSYGIYTELYLSYKAKDMGLNATVVGGADFFATPRNYKFWYQVCSAAKVSAGVLREGPARLTSYIDGNGFSTRLANVEAGVLVDMTIIPGLSASVFLPTSGIAVKDEIKRIAAGVSFTLPNVATVVVAYKPYVKSPRTGVRVTEVSAGVDLKAVKDLTLKVGVANLGAAGDLVSLYATVGKKAGAVNFGADAVAVLKPVSAYILKAMVEYTMGAYVLGAKASIDNDYYALGITGPEGKLLPSYGTYQHNGGLVVNPYLKRNFAAGDIKVGMIYYAKTSAIGFPVDFEISY
jgi:hypothetical protein